MGTDDIEKDLRSLELSDIDQILDEDRFPTTTAAILEEYGDLEVTYPSGSEPLRAILETSGNETYGTSDEAQLAILNGVRRQAVGRARYSDRAYTSNGVREFARSPDSF